MVGAGYIAVEMAQVQDCSKYLTCRTVSHLFGTWDIFYVCCKFFVVRLLFLRLARQKNLTEQIRKLLGSCKIMTFSGFFSA